MPLLNGLNFEAASFILFPKKDATFDPLFADPENPFNAVPAFDPAVAKLPIADTS